MGNQGSSMVVMEREKALPRPHALGGLHGTANNDERMGGGI